METTSLPKTRQPQTLDQIPCQFLKGVGPRLAKCLEKCDVYTIQDVLFHLPYRYQDRTRVTPIRQARVGEWVVIEGVIAPIKSPTQQRRQRQYLFSLSDKTGQITLRFFHITTPQIETLITGSRLRCYGELRFGNTGLTLIHPEYQIIADNNPLPVSQSLTPIYSTTEGVSQHLWRKITDHALLLLNNYSLIDYLPENVLSLHDAIHYIHRPPANANILLLESRQHPAQLRLASEELLAHHLSLRQRRKQIQEHTAPRLLFNKIVHQAFLKTLPFQLTNAQKRVIQDVNTDISAPHPMLRLIQGDVGSGKTIVAALAALQAISNNYQAALMAPTELLAEQHYKQFQHWFNSNNINNIDINIVWLSGQLTAKQRREALTIIQEKNNSIIIGTHALFQSDVQFAKLGLIIIDEQHRFGVEQRLALRQKGLSPHQLMMTATPIPRTLAMTLYADLNISIIDELPPGRTPIKTVVINAQRRSDIIDRIQKASEEKRQIYWVCPLIEESDILQYQAAQTTADTLQKNLPNLNIGLIHGKLKSIEKEKIMGEFKSGKIDLLVATTVIEVGVNVPNASLMVIENAERLGLAQLHQLRGRVGRGSVESYCILLYQPPLSPLAQERLAVMRESQDGFIIAEKDLALRGPGELLGTRQTGDWQLRVADLQRDQHLFPKIHQTADQLLQQHPTYVDKLIQRWLGRAAQFREV